MSRVVNSRWDPVPTEPLPYWHSVVVAILGGVGALSTAGQMWRRSQRLPRGPRNETRGTSKYGRWICGSFVTSPQKP